MVAVDPATGSPLATTATEEGPFPLRLTKLTECNVKLSPSSTSEADSSDVAISNAPSPQPDTAGAQGSSDEATADTEAAAPSQDADPFAPFRTLVRFHPTSDHLFCVAAPGSSTAIVLQCLNLFGARSLACA